MAIQVQLFLSRYSKTFFQTKSLFVFQSILLDEDARSVR